MPTLPPINIQIQRGINASCKDCSIPIDKRSKRCRHCHQRQLMKTRYPKSVVKTGHILECAYCGTSQISYQTAVHGHGRCRQCYFHFKRTVKRTKKRFADRINHGTCYEDKDGVVRYAEELLVCQIGEVEQGVDSGEAIDNEGHNTLSLLPSTLISLGSADENQNYYDEKEDYGDDDEEELKESSGEIMRFTVGQAWGALRRCWKAFRIANNADDEIQQAKYARRIQSLERVLNIQVNDFYGILPQQDLKQMQQQQEKKKEEEHGITDENRGDGEYKEDVILVRRENVVSKRGVCYHHRNDDNNNNNNF
jgi:hypothetical protein